PGTHGRPAGSEARHRPQPGDDDPLRRAGHPHVDPVRARRGSLAADRCRAAGSDRGPADGGASVSDEAAPVSERSRGVALGLCVFGGVFGLHRFYAGRVRSGVWMCLTLGGLGIWYLYDVIVIAAGDFRDGEERRLARWEVAGEGTRPVTSHPRVEDLEDRLLGLESQEIGRASGREG